MEGKPVTERDFMVPPFWYIGGHAENCPKRTTEKWSRLPSSLGPQTPPSAPKCSCGTGIDTKVLKFGILRGDVTHHSRGKSISTVGLIKWFVVGAGIYRDT